MNQESFDIYCQSDLDKLITSKIINGNIVIKGEKPISLNQVECINGTLGICNSLISELEGIKLIKGDFWISCYNTETNLETLGTLEEIQGDAVIRYSSIKSIGNLRRVGGKLSLRDTPIENLGELNSVGDDLFLPMRLKGNLDLELINVTGKTKFWNDKKNRPKIISKDELGLSKSNQEVPFWEHKYIYSKNELDYATPSQRHFYRYFQESFSNGKMIDLEGNDNYVFILFYDLLQKFETHNNIGLLKNQFISLSNSYPIVKGYTQREVIKYFEEKSNFENAWLLQYDEAHTSIDTLLKYTQELKRTILDGKLLIKLGGISHLTAFGQKNIENIEPFIVTRLANYEKEKGTDFFNLFYENGRVFSKKEKSDFSILKLIKKKEKSPDYDADYYKEFFISDSEYKHYHQIDLSQFNSGYNASTFHVVEKAILNQFRLIIQQSEDLYRESIGMPKIGEGWISETELFYLISNAYPNYKVVHHASPKWLGRQHLDIFLPELNIGIEYQGVQHYKPIDFFGGEEAFEKTKERDKNKRQKCKENDCILIYVNEGYDFEEVKNEIDRHV